MKKIVQHQSHTTRPSPPPSSRTANPQPMLPSC